MVAFTECKNGELRPGDLVLSTPDDEYAYLIGRVAQIATLNTPEHDTENETDDVYVDFSAANYSKRRIKEIESMMADLSGEERAFEDCPLDCVIMLPENLVRITGIEQEALAALLESEKAAAAFYANAQRHDFKLTQIEVTAHRRSNYDAACYYDGQLLGRCTIADSNAYAVLMETCENDAARVLREYSYLSPELKAILEKAAAVRAAQTRESHASGLFAQPKSSPWGTVDYCDTLCPGVFLVSTASHGGVMVAKDMEEFLSPAARKCGWRQNGFLCYEEDCDEAVVFRELLDKKLWDIPDRIKDRAAFVESINKTLREYHPEYWRSREHGRQNALPVKHAPAHNER